MISTSQLPKNRTDAGRQGQQIKRIIVAIDGSESADNALDIATKIAKAFAAQIDLIYVSDSHNIVSGSDAPKNAAFSRDLLLERQQGLIAAGLKTRPIHSNSSLARIGDEIVKIASTGSYDLLVMGSRGLGRTKGFFLGSMSKKASIEAKCSVLVSKARVDSINRILLAYDGSEGSRKALMFVAGLAKAIGAVVNVVSAISEPMLSSELDVRAAVEKLDTEMHSYGEQAVKLLRESGVTTEGARVVGARKISIAIANEAAKGSYDLVALGSRGWGKAKSMILGSVALSSLDISKVSVLIVK